MTQEVPAGPEFSLDVRVGMDGTATILVTGELDLVTAPEFRTTVDEQLGRGPVVLELAGLHFMDSSGIAVLDALLRRCVELGRELTVLDALHPQVRQILEITGMLGALALVPVHVEEER